MFVKLLALHRRGLEGQIQIERLVSAVSLVVGFEAFVVQRDIRGLSLDDATELSAWSARALVRAALAETPSLARHGAGRHS